jgi:hypothetical protein
MRLKITLDCQDSDLHSFCALKFLIPIKPKSLKLSFRAERGIPPRSTAGEKSDSSSLCTSE